MKPKKLARRQRTPEEMDAADSYRTASRANIALHILNDGGHLSGDEEHAFFLREVGTSAEIDKTIECALHVVSNVHRGS